MTPLVLEQIYREDAGRIVASLIRLIGDFDLAEEAAQEAFATDGGTMAARGRPAKSARLDYRHRTA